jgi:hypothetical protein
MDTVALPMEGAEAGSRSTRNVTATARTATEAAATHNVFARSHDQRPKPA